MKNTILINRFFGKRKECNLYALEAFHPSNTHMFVALLPTYSFDSDVTISSVIRCVRSLMLLWKQKQYHTSTNGKVVSFDKMAYLGFLNEAVNYVAEEKHPDLVVMGTKGETGLPAILLGSHASSLIKAINIPLLIIPEEAKFSGLKNIVLAAHLHSLSKPVHLEPLRELADIFDSKLTVINVVKDESHHDDTESDESKSVKTSFSDNQIEFKFVYDHNVEHVSPNMYTTTLRLTRRRRTQQKFIVDLFHKSVSQNLALHGERLC